MLKYLQQNSQSQRCQECQWTVSGTDRGWYTCWQHPQARQMFGNKGTWPSHGGSHRPVDGGKNKTKINSILTRPLLPNSMHQLCMCVWCWEFSLVIYYDKNGDNNWQMHIKCDHQVQECSRSKPCRGVFVSMNIRKLLDDHKYTFTKSYHKIILCYALTLCNFASQLTCTFVNTEINQNTTNRCLCLLFLTVQYWETFLK